MPYCPFTSSFCPCVSYYPAPQFWEAVIHLQRCLTHGIGELQRPLPFRLRRFPSRLLVPSFPFPSRCLYSSISFCSHPDASFCTASAQLPPFNWSSSKCHNQFSRRTGGSILARGTPAGALRPPASGVLVGWALCAAPATRPAGGAATEPDGPYGPHVQWGFIHTVKMTLMAT